MMEIKLRLTLFSSNKNVYIVILLKMHDILKYKIYRIQNNKNIIIYNKNTNKRII